MRWKPPLIAGAVVLMTALAAALAAFMLGGHGEGRADANDPALVALGSRVYGAECARCHGAQLEGQANWRERLPSGRLPAPPHDASGHTWHHPDRQLFDITKEGLANVVPGYATDMPAYKGALSDREIWAVLAYIKSTWPAEIRARQERMTLQSGG